MGDTLISAEKLIEKLAREQLQMKHLGMYEKATAFLTAIRMVQDMADPPPRPSLDNSE